MLFSFKFIRLDFSEAKALNIFVGGGCAGLRFAPFVLEVRREGRNGNGDPYFSLLCEGLAVPYHLMLQVLECVWFLVVTLVIRLVWLQGALGVCVGVWEWCTLLCSF